MTLYENTVNMGNWLFRWRGYLPLIFILIVLPGLLKFSYPNGSHKYDLIWEMTCLTVSCLGIMIRCYTVGHSPRGTSGRNTKSHVAKTLNTTGIYSIVRNPLYLGNFFIVFGITMFVRAWWVCLIYTMAFWLYYERIIFSEENFLIEKFGKFYTDYAKCTPVFLPDFRMWKPPAFPFSWKRILRREYSGLFGVITAYTIMEFTGEFIVHKGLFIEKVWEFLFLGTLLLYISISTIKKKTGLLNAEER